ncbi:hypothetical protein DUI87_30537 [Hirundo rustica rustica]|uniref:Nucleophosmin n=1 Tax=Hirundo rustica rustica TaxID=333673 RepID=A0A3M0IUH7_HIRRU|nr:hypothetical protein DUI87_30537 [Hirundo rustica rustica]
MGTDSAAEKDPLKALCKTIEEMELVLPKAEAGTPAYLCSPMQHFLVLKDVLMQLFMLLHMNNILLQAKLGMEQALLKEGSRRKLPVPLTAESAAQSRLWVTLGAGAKDELHIVEAEALDYEGNPTKVVLASLKMSVQPTVECLLSTLCLEYSAEYQCFDPQVSLGGFEITPPVVLRLKCGSGPVYISGQHLVALEEEPESDEEEDDTKIVNASTKRPASGGGAKTPQKKPKLVEDDEDDDEDDDDEDDDEDDLEDDEEEVKAPVKKPVREVAGKNMQKAKQNGKDSKPSTPASKSKLYVQVTNEVNNFQTPDSKKDKTLTPKTPKVPLSLEEIKAKMQASVDKGTTLPKLEPKFANYVKNCFRTEDQKVKIQLWNLIQKQTGGLDWAGIKQKSRDVTLNLETCASN